MEDSKSCTKCGREWPPTGFHKDRNRRDGLAPWCKVCATENTRRHRAANRDDLELRRRASYRENPEPAKRRARQWARENPEVVRAAAKARYQRNAAARREATREYRKRYPDRVRASKLSARRKKPDLYRMLNLQWAASRRSRLAEAACVPFTAEQLDQRLAFYGYRCWICRRAYEQIDHVKPLAKGGGHLLANLRPICQPCNGSKGAKWPWTPREDRYALQVEAGAVQGHPRR